MTNEGKAQEMTADEREFQAWKVEHDKYLEGLKVEAEAIKFARGLLRKHDGKCGAMNILAEAGRIIADYQGDFERLEADYKSVLKWKR